MHARRDREAIWQGMSILPSRQLRNCQGAWKEGDSERAGASTVRGQRASTMNVTKED